MEVKNKFSTDLSSKTPREGSKIELTIRVLWDMGYLPLGPYFYFYLNRP
jgi:hypothetical protein